jgi:hypothetical protein
VGKRPEKLKSYDDDQKEHSRGGGDWRVLSMQRNGEYCMHKMHRIYIYMVQRREGLLLLLELAMILAGEGDSCVKKKESATTELKHKRICVVNGYGAQSLKGRRTESARGVQKTLMQTWQSSVTEQRQG